MALVSVQISLGAVHLPWNIVGEYNSYCTLVELYQSIKTGSNPIDMWEFPFKFDRYLVSAAIGKSKTSVFEETKNKIKNLPPSSVFFFKSA